MLDLLWLLLPIAAATGWWSAYRHVRNSTNTQSEGFRHEYIKGLNYLLNEQPDKALELFVRMVEVDSDTVDTHLLLGTLFRKRGEVERAIRIHQNLIARPHLDGVHRATALLELGKDYMHAGLLDRAEGLYKELLGTGYLRTPANRELQRLYEQEKDWANAIRYAEASQSASGEPQQSVIAHYWCESAEEQRKRGRMRLALEQAKQALSRDPTSVRASILLGDLALEDREARLAGKYYSRVIEQNPDFMPVVFPKLTEAYKLSGDRRGFMRLLTKIGNERGSGENVIYVAQALLDQGDEEGARHTLLTEIERQVAPVRLLREYISLEQNHRDIDAGRSLGLVVRVLDEYLAQWFGYRCTHCGFRSRNLFWQCPSCHSWGAIKPYHSPDDQLWSS